MYWDVVEAHVTDNTSLWVRFADGVEGKVTCTPSFFTGVFEPLSDPAYFQRVMLVNGVVTWPQECDLAPDAMYAAIKRKGQWVLA